MWQRVHQSIYATFNGDLPRPAVVWAALLAAGDGGAVSHETAAELAGFARPRDPVHITVPFSRHPPTIAGASIHRSRRLSQARHPTRSPPQTRVEETVFDLTDRAASLGSAISWLTAACGARVTTPERLKRAMDGRPRIRWRGELTEALGVIDDGAASALERRYLRDVERAHALPRGNRQVRRQRFNSNIYDDVSYDGFGVIVELDGRAAHPIGMLFRDMDRDNVAARRGDLVLHYGWDEVTTSPCRIAIEVSEILKARGWAGRLRRCRRPNCMIVASGGSI